MSNICQPIQHPFHLIRLSSDFSNIGRKSEAYFQLIKPVRMKSFLFKFTGLGLFAALLFLTSCGDDDPITTNPLGPDVQFVDDPATLSTDSDVIINDGFSVKVRLIKGDAPLKSMEITAGGVKLDISRLTINGGAVSPNNPFLILGTAVDGVTYTFDIASSGTEAVGDITTYVFKATDTNDQTDEVDIIITTIAQPGTPLSQTLNGVLFNQAGPAGTGGLDLDTGNGTGSSDAAAEIRDLGIDCALPNASNWRRQIGTVNGAEMKKVDVAQLENFTFAGVDKKEPIIQAFTTGIALANGTSSNCAGVNTPVTDVSDAVVVGDMFVVFANSNYYLVRIDAVNPTTDSNGDSYELSIKY